MHVEPFLSGDPRRPPKKKQERQEPQQSQPLPQKTGFFTVYMTEDAQKSYNELDANIKEGMNELMERLRMWPEVSGVRSLFGKGYAPNKFRMKVGHWRMEFLVNLAERTIAVIKIGPRDSFYDEYH